MTWPGADNKQNCAPCTLQRGQVEYEEGDEKGEEGKSQADHWNLNTLGEAGQWNPQVGQADHWNLNNACRSSSSLIPWETSSSIPPPPVKYFWIIVKRFSAHQSKQIEWSLCEPSPPLTNFSVRVQDYVFHLYVIYCYISPGKKYLPNPKRFSLSKNIKIAAELCGWLEIQIFKIFCWSQNVTWLMVIRKRVSSLSKQFV